MMNLLAHLMKAPDGVRRQGGQALVESLIAMLGLAVLWVALHWLAHYQDAALSATHASRHAAFVASRGELEERASAPEVVAPFFTGSAHRWTDRRGQAILESETGVSLSLLLLEPLSVSAQPGGGLTQASTLRRDWELEDAGLVRARVGLDFNRRQAVQPDADTGFLKLRAFHQAYPSLARSTRILTGAGHAASDTEAQSKVAESSLAWAAAHAVSRAAGGEINVRADGVEAGWGRSTAGFDWLQPWSGRVPGHLITEYASEGRN